MFDNDGQIKLSVLDLIAKICELPATEFCSRPILERQGNKKFLKRVNNMKQLRDVAISMKCRGAFDDAVA